MTAEKHPLQKVQNTLQESARGCSAIELIAPNIKDAREYASMMKAEIDAALNILNTYLCQPQSCAECERMGRENARLKEAVRDLGNMLSDVGPAFEALHDEWIEIEGCEPYQPILDQVAEIKNMLFEKHAATIAAASKEQEKGDK